MHHKHNNKTEENKNIEQTTINNDNTNQKEQNEVITDEELIEKKKKENQDNYIFNVEADILLGRDDNKPQRVIERKPGKTKVEDKHKNTKAKGYEVIKPENSSKPEENIEKVEDEIQNIEPIKEDIYAYTETTVETNNDTLDEAKQDEAKTESVNVELENLKVKYEMLEEKNKNLARILKEISVELKGAREENEKQFEVIGKLASEKQNLEQQNTELVIKANKLELDVEVKEGELATFRQLGDGASDIKNTLTNFKETTQAINDELDDKKIKLKDSLVKIMELEAKQRELESELNKVNDEKADLSIIVLQQKKKLENQDNLESYANSGDGKNVDYKELDRKLKNELDEYSEQARNKDRVIVRQIDDIAKLNNTITELNKEILEYQDKIDDLTAKHNKHILENNATKNLIKPNNGSLLGKVMDNELDLKLKNHISFTKEKLLSDEEISNLLDKIDHIINDTEKDNKTEKQYKFELFEGIQGEVVEFINEVVQKEATAYDYIVAMNDFEYKKEKITNEYETKLNNLNKELSNAQKLINKLRIEIFNKTSITDDGRTIIEYKDDNKRLNNRLEFLKEENEILANEITDEAIMHLIKVFESERDSNRETEKLLKDEIAILKEKLAKSSSDLEKLNGEYILSQLDSEVERINNFITGIEEGKVQLKSNILDMYYNEAYEKFSKQSLIYNDEIAKRDELLKQLLDDKSEDLGKMVEKDINGELTDDTETKEKIKHNESMIDAIENVLGSKIVKFDLEPKQAVDKKIFVVFKDTLQNMYDKMIKNINDNAKAFTDELTETNAVKAIELFNNDVNKMAKYYSQAVDEAFLEQTANTNEFAKVIGSAKLAILCNEFATLLKFKEEKSREKFNGINHENGDYNNNVNSNFGTSLSEINEVKKALNDKIAKLNETFGQEMIALNDEVAETKKQIQAINELINNDSEADVASLNIDLDAKNKVLSYLENEKKNGIIDNLNKQIQDIKLQLETIDNTERRNKEDYLDRSTNEAQYNKDMNTVSINDAYGIKEINKYLQNLNNIELGYFESINNNDNELISKVNAIQEQMDELSKKTVYYRNLILLKDQLLAAKNVMKTDYAQIREFEQITNECNYLNNQVAFYNNEITKAKERINCGIDSSQNKDNLLMYQAKLHNLNAQLDAKNNELEEIKNYQIVVQYIEAIEKINKIDEIIKEKGKEIE